MSHRSIRVRLTAASTLVVMIVLISAAIALVTLSKNAQLSSIDRAAWAKAQEIRTQIQTQSPPQSIAAPIGDATIAQVIDDNGTVVASTSNAQVLRLFPHKDGHAISTSIPTSEEPDSYRVVALPVPTTSGPQTVLVALQAENVSESTGNLITLLCFGVPALIVATALGTWLLTGRTLRPVEVMRREVEEISYHALDKRLENTGTSDELSRLGDTMNALLERLEIGTRNQRQFVEDASHELRSPLATLHAQLDVAEDSDLKNLATTQVLRMEALVADLLLLARANGAAARHHEIDFDDVVLDAVNLSQLRADLPPVHLAAFSPARILGDPASLLRMITNLLDNAQRHATSSVDVRLDTSSVTVTMLVSDDGSGIPTEDRERIFERFTRLDEARSRDSGGSGLGLPISRSVARQHGGDVTVVDSEIGATFKVELPIHE